MKADVCDRAQMEEKVKEIGEKDGIDFLINNAGVTVKCRAENFKMEDFDRICRRYGYVKVILQRHASG